MMRAAFWKRTICIFTAVVMAFTLLPVFSADAADYSDTCVRVGLAYGTSGKNAAVFQVATGTGTGFQAGWVDADTDVFTACRALNVTKVTVARSSQNYRFSDGVYVADGSDAAYTLGRWHLELSAAPADEAAAEALLAAVFTGVGDLASCYIAYTDAGYRVRVGTYTSQASANLSLEVVTGAVQSVTGQETISVRTVSGGSCGFFVLDTATGVPLFELDDGVHGVCLKGTGGDAPEIYFRTPAYGTRCYYGLMDCVPDSGASVFSVVNVVRLDLYVRGVVPYEVNTYWPDEALKTMAVIVATYAMCNQGRHASAGFDICNNDHCEVYKGIGSDSLRNETETILRCCDAVRGMVITYGGKPIQAVYHSSSGGVTENSEDVWAAALPYLRSVKDNFEEGTLGTTEAARGIWRHTLTATQVQERLTECGYSIGTVTDVWISATAQSGSALTLSVSDGTRTVNLNKENMRFVLGTDVLYSQHFTVYTSGQVYVNEGDLLENGLKDVYVLTGTGTATVLGDTARTALTGSGQEVIACVTESGEVEWTFDGAGWGHGVGLSAWGCYGMAKQGYTFDRIIKHYYTGVSIAGFDK